MAEKVAESLTKKDKGEKSRYPFLVSFMDFAYFLYKLC